MAYHLSHAHACTHTVAYLRQKERDRLHLMVQEAASSPLSTSRSHISSLSHRRLLQWYTIDLLSPPHDREKDGHRATPRDIETVRTEGKATKRKWGALLMSLSCLFCCGCCCHAVDSRTRLFIERQNKDGLCRQNGADCFFCFSVLEVNSSGESGAERGRRVPSENQIFPWLLF